MYRNMLIPTIAKMSKKAMILEAVLNLFASIASSCNWAGVGGPPALAIACPILAILKLTGLLIEKPIRKAIIANTPPAVRTCPFIVDNHTASSPPETFHINKTPARTVMIAKIIIMIGNRLVFASCCMNLTPSGPADLTAGSRKKATKITVPAQDIPQPIWRRRRISR